MKKQFEPNNSFQDAKNFAQHTLQQQQQESTPTKVFRLKFKWRTHK